MTELITRMNEAMPLGYQLAFLIRVLVATLCGGAIGLERTKRLKEAGIRTHCAAVYLPHQHRPGRHLPQRQHPKGPYYRGGHLGHRRHRPGHRRRDVPHRHRHYHHHYFDADHHAQVQYRQ